MSMLKVVMVWVLTDDDIHSVWKSQKKSHSTLWAMLTFEWTKWSIEKLKLPVKKCYQTGQKLVESAKIKKSNATFWVIFKHCDEGTPFDLLTLVVSLFLFKQCYQSSPLIVLLHFSHDSMVCLTGTRVESRIVSPGHHSKPGRTTTLTQRKTTPFDVSFRVGYTLSENSIFCPKTPFSRKFWIWIFQLKSHDFWEFLNVKIG